MEPDTQTALAALAAGTLALIGAYTVLTAFLLGATATIDMLGYAVGTLLVYEGLGTFAARYSRLE